MANYCLLPSEQQKRFAQYLAKEYDAGTRERYLAVATNPAPCDNGRLCGKVHRDRRLPILDLSQLKRNYQPCQN